MSCLPLHDSVICNALTRYKYDNAPVNMKRGSSFGKDCVDYQFCLMFLRFLHIRATATIFKRERSDWSRQNIHFQPPSNKYQHHVVCIILVPLPCWTKATSGIIFAPTPPSGITSNRHPSAAAWVPKQVHIQLQAAVAVAVAHAGLCVC